jgi:vacuolar protein sorting-associated protein 13A/C
MVFFQSTNFWPETETMRMFVRLRGSQLVSPAFPIGRQHRTVLRMDKGCGLTVEVVSESGPLCVWFRHAASGEAPVRVDNQCSELAVKLQQRDATASWLLGPGQALLYTWDEPCREPRELLWSISKVYVDKSKSITIKIVARGVQASRNFIIL